MTLGHQPDDLVTPSTSSISLIPPGRFTTNGTTVWGKTTSERSGSKGTREEHRRVVRTFGQDEAAPSPPILRNRCRVGRTGKDLRSGLRSTNGGRFSSWVA